MSHDRCFHECYNRGFRYAGLANMYECWCGDNFNENLLTNDTKCDCPCRGNPYEQCGCGFHSIIYQVDPVSFEDCFFESY